MGKDTTKLNRKIVQAKGKRAKFAISMLIMSKEQRYWFNLKSELKKN